MATRSEQFRANEERHAKKKPKRAARSKPGSPPKKRKTAKQHAAQKATVALETVAKGKRASRKSTRSSANRAKSDTTYNLIEELKKGSPESRYRKSRAHDVRVRGHR